MQNGKSRVIHAEVNGELATGSIVPRRPLDIDDLSVIVSSEPKGSAGFPKAFFSEHLVKAFARDPIDGGNYGTLWHFRPAA